MTSKLLNIHYNSYNNDQQVTKYSISIPTTMTSKLLNIHYNSYNNDQQVTKYSISIPTTMTSKLLNIHFNSYNNDQQVTKYSFLYFLFPVQSRCKNGPTLRSQSKIAETDPKWMEEHAQIIQSK